MCTSCNGRWVTDQVKMLPVESYGLEKLFPCGGFSMVHLMNGLVRKSRTGLLKDVLPTSTCQFVSAMIHGFSARSSNGVTLRFETGLLFFKSGKTVGPTANQKNKKEKKGPRKPAKTVSKTRRTNLRSPPQRRNARTMHQLKWTHPAKRTRFHRNCSSHGSPQWQNQVD